MLTFVDRGRRHNLGSQPQPIDIDVMLDVFGHVDMLAEAADMISCRSFNLLMAT